MESRIRIVSPDRAFAESIGSRLAGRGVSVAVEPDLERVTPSLLDEERVDLVLLDVRQRADGVLGWLASTKRALPAVEVVLLNVSGEIRLSIEGMRAGASNELSAPIDAGALRSAVSAALRRRKKRLGRARPSLLERFERAMSAATFAQAGEHETARELLDEGGPPARRARGKAAGAEGGAHHRGRR
jgi:DNA-binding NtrC family response regulator